MSSDLSSPFTLLFCSDRETKTWPGDAQIREKYYSQFVASSLEFRLESEKALVISKDDKGKQD